MGSQEDGSDEDLERLASTCWLSAPPHSSSRFELSLARPVACLFFGRAGRTAKHCKTSTS